MRHSAVFRALCLVATAGLLVAAAAGRPAPPWPPGPSPRQAQANAPVQLGPRATLRTNVVLDTNPTLFAILAAINVGGYQAGLRAPDASPLRVKIRDQILAQKLPVFGELRMYYADHRLADPAADLAQYISLALVTGDPPEFQRLMPLEDLPPDAQNLQDFLPLLRRFYQEANIAEIWRQYRPDYEAAIADYAPQVRKVMRSVDLYFRLPQAYLGRQFVILPEVLASPVQTHARNFLDNYFIVVNLDVASQLNDIRHTYLHYVLDPLVEKYPDIYERARPVFMAAQRAPALDPEFKDNLRLFYTECLVRAVEIRLTPLPQVPAKRRDAARLKLVDQDMSEGFVLTRFFYEQLQAYEADVLNFSEFYPQGAYMLQPSRVAGEARHMKFAAARPHAEPTQPQPLISLLEAGENRLRLDDLVGATALTRSALADPHGDHPTAYFLMAEIAVRERQTELAVKYFDRCLATAPLTDAHIRTWSNIYLGRILDLEQQRAEAVAHYKAALATADTSGSRALAQSGIAAPFTAPTAPPGRHDGKRPGAQAGDPAPRS